MYQHRGLGWFSCGILWSEIAENPQSIRYFPVKTSIFHGISHCRKSPRPIHERLTMDAPGSEIFFPFRIHERNPNRICRCQYGAIRHCMWFIMVHVMCWVTWVSHINSRVNILSCEISHFLKVNGKPQHQIYGFPNLNCHVSDSVGFSYQKSLYWEIYSGNFLSLQIYKLHT